MPFCFVAIRYLIFAHLPLKARRDVTNDPSLTSTAAAGERYSTGRRNTDHARLFSAKICDRAYRLRYL